MKESASEMVWAFDLGKGSIGSPRGVASITPQGEAVRNRFSGRNNALTIGNQALVIRRRRRPSGISRRLLGYYFMGHRLFGEAAGARLSVIANRLFIGDATAGAAPDAVNF